MFKAVMQCHKLNGPWLADKEKPGLEIRAWLTMLVR
jgi:hypothetical protein